MRKIFHILLAVLVFVSSSGLVLSKHYCGGDLKNTALFVEAASCHARAGTKTCPRHAITTTESTSIKKNSCCANVTDFLKNADRQLNASAELPYLPTPVFAALLPAPRQRAFALPFFRPADYLHYKPPLLVCDLPIRLQAFLC